MFRTFIILIALILAVYIGRKLLSSAKSPPGQQRKQASPKNMVRCATCGLHVPESEAIMLNHKPYCSKEHARTHSD